MFLSLVVDKPVILTDFLNKMNERGNKNKLRATHASRVARVGRYYNLQFHRIEAVRRIKGITSSKQFLNS